MTKVIHLSWISHHTAFSTIIPNFRANNTFCDVTVSCNGNYFPAHRLILSTFSEYFREILEKVPCRHPFIIIQDCEVEDLKDLLNFIYVGEASVSSQRIASFLKAATTLKIRGLGISDESNLSSLTDFQEKIQNLSKTVIDDSSSTQECSDVLTSPSTSEIKRGRGRPKSFAKIKPTENPSENVIANKKQMRIEETKCELEDESLNVDVKRLLKNSRVVIENCPQAIKLCKNLITKSEKSTDHDDNVSYPTSLHNEDDLFSESVHPRMNVDPFLPVKEEPLEYDEQLESDKNEGSIFSIENVYSVKGKADPVLTGGYSTSTLLSNNLDSNQENLQKSKTFASKEGEMEASDSVSAEGCENDESMEYIRVKIEPFDDIYCDGIPKDDQIESKPNSLETSVYDYLTTELGADSISDGSQSISHKTEELFQGNCFGAEDPPHESSDVSHKTHNLFHESNNLSQGTDDLTQGSVNQSRGIVKLSRRKVCKTKKLLKNKGRYGLSKKKLSCGLCDYKTAFTQNLKVHMRTHTGEKPYICTFCPYKSTQKNALDKHIQTHTEKKVLKCEHCSFETKRRREIDEHKKTHTETLTYKCDHCSFCTSRNQSLQTHLKKHFSEDYTPDSDNSFEIKEYKKILVEGVTYNCLHCSFSSIWKQSFQKHMKKHFQKDGKNLPNSNNSEQQMEIEQAHYYKCDYCPFHTTWTQSLRNHLKKHFPLDENMPDRDNSLEPKKFTMQKIRPYKSRKKIGAYKSRKRSLLSRKMFALKMKEAIKMKKKTVSNVTEGGVAQPGIFNELPTILNTEETSGLSKVSDNASFVRNNKNSEYLKEAELPEIKRETAILSSESGQIPSETSPCRIAREKKLLALSLIKKNLDATEAASDYSTDGQTSRISEFKKRKYKMRKKKMTPSQKLTTRAVSGSPNIGFDDAHSFPISPLTFNTKSTTIPMVSIPQSFSNKTVVPFTSSIPSISMIRSSIPRMIPVPATPSSFALFPGIPRYPGIVSLPSTSRNLSPSVTLVGHTCSAPIYDLQNKIKTTPLSTGPIIPADGNTIDSLQEAGKRLHLTKKEKSAKPYKAGKRLHLTKNEKSTEPYVQPIRIVSFESLREIPIAKDVIPDAVPDSIVSNIPVVSSVSNISDSTDAPPDSKSKFVIRVRTVSDTQGRSDVSCTQNSSTSIKFPGTLDAHTCSYTNVSSKSSSIRFNSTSSETCVASNVIAAADVSRKHTSTVLNEHDQEISLPKEISKHSENVIKLSEHFSGKDD